MSRQGKIFTILFTLTIYASTITASENDTLAVIGKKIIYAGEFAKQYQEKINKVGFNDSYEFRRKYLDNLINDELLISEAKSRGMSESDKAKKEFARIKIQELLNIYSVVHISPDAVVADEDLKDLFVKLNTRIKVSHLFAPTKEKADYLYGELTKGRSFDELAKECFTNPILKNNGGSLGYITIDEMDPEFEKAAYSMKPGEISKPVKTVQGYSIIKVEDIVSNPLLTENEFLKSYERLKAFVRKRAFEQLSKEHAADLRIKLNTKFNDEGIALLFSAYEKNNLSEEVETPSLFSASELKKLVVVSDIGRWNVETSIKELGELSDKQRKFIRTKENLSDAISGLVNRKYIISKSIEEGFDKLPSFKENVNYQFDIFLLTMIEEEIKSAVKISPDTLHAYYSGNKDKFTTPAKIKLSSILVDNSSIADSLTALLQQGAAFEDLAKKYSIQTFTSHSGGDMGFFKKEELEGLGDEVFSMNVGQWKGPFINNGNYVFLKCTGYLSPEVRSFEDSKKEIEATLSSFEFYRLRDRYVEEIKTKIHVEAFPEKLTSLNLLTKN